VSAATAALQAASSSGAWEISRALAFPSVIFVFIRLSISITCASNRLLWLYLVFRLQRLQGGVNKKKTPIGF
jgi:hypothetical protein